MEGRRAWIGSLQRATERRTEAGKGRHPLRLNTGRQAGPRRALPDATVIAHGEPNAGSAPPRGSPHPHSRDSLENAAAATGAQGPLEGFRVLEPGSQPAASRSPTSLLLSRQRTRRPAGSDEAAHRFSKGTASDAAPAPRRGSTLTGERGWVVFGSLQRVPKTLSPQISARAPACTVLKQQATRPGAIAAARRRLGSLSRHAAAGSLP